MGLILGSPLTFLTGVSAGFANSKGESLGKYLNIYQWLNHVSGVPSGSRPYESYIMPFSDGGVSFRFTDVNSSMVASVIGEASVSIDISGTAIFNFHVSEGLVASVSIAGVGSLNTVVSGLATTGIRIVVSELTQDDVAGAVVSAKIDGVHTLSEYLKLIAAAVAGKASISVVGPNKEVTFRNINDTQDAIIGEYDLEGNRIDVSYNFGD